MSAICVPARPKLQVALTEGGALLFLAQHVGLSRVPLETPGNLFIPLAVP